MTEPAVLTLGTFSFLPEPTRPLRLEDTWMASYDVIVQFISIDCSKHTFVAIKAFLHSHFIVSFHVLFTFLLGPCCEITETALVDFQLVDYFTVLHQIFNAFASCSTKIARSH